MERDELRRGRRSCGCRRSQTDEGKQGKDWENGERGGGSIVH